MTATEPEAPPAETPPETPPEVPPEETPAEAPPEGEQPEAQGGEEPALLATTTKPLDYLGRRIATPASAGKDWVGRNVVAGDKDYLGRALTGTMATGATAGIPGSFTPAGATPPGSFAEMTGIAASPGTNWTVGQYVAHAGGNAYWNGTAWVAGIHP